MYILHMRARLVLNLGLLKPPSCVCTFPEAPKVVTLCADSFCRYCARCRTVLVTASHVIPVITVVRSATNSAAAVAPTSEVREPATLCYQLYYWQLRAERVYDVCLRIALLSCYLRAELEHRLRTLRAELEHRLRTLRLSRKFCISAIFITAGLQQVPSVLCTNVDDPSPHKFHASSCTVSRATAIKPKATENLVTAAMLVPYRLHNNTVTTGCILLQHLS
jgi:hypothetical protein